MRKLNSINLVFIIILITFPLVLGAAPQLIQGIYTAIILFTCGTWLALNTDKTNTGLFTKSHLPIFVLIIFIFLTSIPLPAFLLQILSPVRADYLITATHSAQLNNTITSLSYYAPDTRSYSVYLLGLYLYYLCLVHLSLQNNDRRLILWILMIMGSFQAFYGILQTIIPDLGILWVPGTELSAGFARGTINNGNQYATFLNICWPMTIALGIFLYDPVISRYNALKNRKGNVSLKDRLTLVFQTAALPFWAAGFMVLAIIFSGSTAGISVMLLSAAGLMMILPFRKRVKILGGSFLLLFIFLYGSLSNLQKITSIFSALYESTQQRLQLWVENFALLKDHLLTGIGMDTYKFLAPFYREKISDSAGYDFALSEYTGLIVELGLPVSILLLIWAIWHLWQYNIRIFRAGWGIRSFTFYPEDIIIAIASFCAVVGFMLQGFADVVWRLPVNALYIVTVLALLKTTFTSGQFDEKR